MSSYREKYPDRYEDYKKRLNERYKNDTDFRMKRQQYSQIYEADPKNIQRRTEQRHEKIKQRSIEKKAKQTFHIIQKTATLLFS